MPDKDVGEGKVAFAGGFGGNAPKNVRGSKVKSIGDNSQFLKFYTDVKAVQQLINFKVNYILKDGWFISSRDEEAKAKVEEFFRNINVEEIFYVWIKNAFIYGNGYMEMTSNYLKPLDSRKMTMYIDEEGVGEVVAYVQEIGQTPDDYTVFDPENMIVLKNNPIDHLRGLSDLLGFEDIINLDYSAMTDIGVALNRAATLRHHYTIGTDERPVPPGSEKFEKAVELINGLLPGQDLITNHEVKAQLLDHKTVGMDYKAYIETITRRMCAELGIPSDFWYNNIGGDTITQRRRIFEEVEVVYKRRVIESIINTELIPRIVKVSSDEPVEFKFGDVNVDQKFVERKIDLIELQTGAKTPDEHRIEEGRDPIENPAASPTTPQQIPISSRDETSESTIGGNLTGQRNAQ